MILSHWRPYWTVTDDLLWIESALFDHERRRNKIESALYAVAYVYTRCIEAMFDWTCLYDFTVITFYWCDAITILLLVHTFNIQKKLYNFLCMNNCIYVSIVKKTFIYNITFLVVVKVVGIICVLWVACGS